MLRIKHSFLDENGQPWVVITNSVHQLCAHSWELFELNNGSSISKWSESPLEAWNKHVRSFKSGTSSRSRQTSIRANLHDIFRRMLITSHPAISSKRYRPLCRICGRHGHSARNAIHNADHSNSNQEDADLLKSLYIDSWSLFTLFNTEEVLLHP